MVQNVLLLLLDPWFMRRFNVILWSVHTSVTVTCWHTVFILPVMFLFFLLQKHFGDLPIRKGKRLHTHTCLFTRWDLQRHSPVRTLQLGWPLHEGDDFHPQENIHKMADGEPLTDQVSVCLFSLNRMSDVRRHFLSCPVNHCLVLAPRTESDKCHREGNFSSRGPNVG